MIAYILPTTLFIVLLNKAAFAFEFCNVLLGPECKAVRESHIGYISMQHTNVCILSGVCLPLLEGGMHL